MVAVWVTALSPKESLNVNYFTPICTFTPIPTPRRGHQIGCKGQSPGAMRGAQSKVTGQLTGLGAGRSYWAPGKYFWALGSHAGRWAIMLGAGRLLRLAFLLARHSVRLVQATAVHRVAVALNQLAATTG